MDFLEISSPPKLNQEERDNLNWLISRNKSWVCNKKSHTNKKNSQHQMASQANSSKHTKKNLYPSFLNSSKRLKRRNTPKDIQWSHHHLIPKSKILPKKKIIANIFNEYRCKNSQQSFSQLNPTILKKYHTLQPSGFHPKFTRMIQHMQINQCNTQH